MSKFEFNMFASDKGILVYNGDNPLLHGITLNPNFKVTDEDNGVDAVATTHAYLAYLTDMLASGEFVVNQKLLYRLPAQTAPQAPHAPHDDDLASLSPQPANVSGLAPLEQKNIGDDIIDTRTVSMLQRVLDNDAKRKGQLAVWVHSAVVGATQKGQYYLTLHTSDNEEIRLYDNRKGDNDPKYAWKNPFSISAMGWEAELAGAMYQAAKSGARVTFRFNAVVAILKSGDFTNLKKVLYMNLNWEQVS